MSEALTRRSSSVTGLKRPGRSEAAESLEVAAAMLGSRAVHDVSIAQFCTYRVGGPAALFFQVEAAEDLRLVARVLTAIQIPVLVVGRGSNLLVAEAGFPGLALRLGESFSSLEIPGRLPAADSERAGGHGFRARVLVGGATSLPVLARRTAAAGMRGLEWAVGIPGSVGGAVRMNAGGHGSSVAERLVWADVFDLSTGDQRRMSADELELGYRRSNLRPAQVVVGAEFRVEPGEASAAEELVSEIVRWRREHQPGGANAGSVFTNPPGDSAGRIIEMVGLKGLRVGSAQVSTKHANFFQADEDGSADDVRALILEVQRLVEQRAGVRLEPELRMVGFGHRSEVGLGPGRG